jgi:hypothetical protein
MNMNTKTATINLRCNGIEQRGRPAVFTQYEIQRRRPIAAQSRSIKVIQHKWKLTVLVELKSGLVMYDAKII